MKKIRDNRKNTTDVPQVTDKCSHIKFYRVHLATHENRTKNFSDNMHCLNRKMYILLPYDHDPNGPLKKTRTVITIQILTVKWKKKISTYGSVQSLLWKLKLCTGSPFQRRHLIEPMIFFRSLQKRSLTAYREGGTLQTRYQHDQAFGITTWLSPIERTHPISHLAVDELVSSIDQAMGTSTNT